MGQLNFKKPFVTVSYFTAARPGSGTRIWVFLYILRNKNIGQSLFRKHSKFQNFHEIFHCGMTKLENTILNYCCLCR